MANRPNPHAGYSFYSNEEQQYAYFDHDAHAPSGGFAAELGDAQPQTLLGYSGPHHALLPQSQSQLHVSHHTLAADASNKHRRSRSGCLTCRSRRVKVSFLKRYASNIVNNVPSSAMNFVPFANVSLVLVKYCIPADCT